MADSEAPFRGRLALVTGGASGIGEAVCRGLAAEGATLVVADKQLEAARKVARSLPGDGKHLAVYVDVGDYSSVEELFNHVRSNFTQPLSVVVNSAGILRSAPLVDCSEELFDDVIRVNLKGTFLVTRAASRYVLRSGIQLPEGGAAIVNIASVAANAWGRATPAYASSKAGVIALTKTTAKELAAHGIRCNAVLPGWTDTPMSGGEYQKHKEAAVSTVPLKRAARPLEVAEAIKFLCSAASSYVTGAALEVAGGLNI
ncbi:(3R)-3-hydroxyacyl-CoA dehydrogenase-like [Amblyomma americanum]